MFPPPDEELWSLAAVPRAKLPTGSFRVTVYDDWGGNAGSPRKEEWFRDLFLADEPAPEGASATRWSETENGIDIAPVRAAVATVASNGMGDSAAGKFDIPGVPTLVAPDPREVLIQNRTIDVGPLAYRACAKGNTLYPTAYPESAEARTRVVVRIDQAPDRLGLTLSAPDHASRPIVIEVLRLPREHLMDRNGSKALLQECDVVETLQVSAAGSARWTLNAQAFAPLDRVVLRQGQPPKAPLPIAEPVQAASWLGFGRKRPEMPPRPAVASPPVLVEFFVEGLQNAGFGPCLALANYLLDLEPDLPLSRVLRNEQPEPGTATRAHAARRLCLPSQLAYLQHARNFGGNRVSTDYLAHADRATLSQGAPDLTDRDPVMTDLIERHAKDAVGLIGEPDTGIGISRHNLDELLLSEQVPLDHARALVMNGTVFRMLLTLDVRPAPGSRSRFHADLCNLLDAWTDEAFELDWLAQIVCPDDRPALGAAPDEWQDWVRRLSDQYLGNALFDWMTANARTVPHLMELTPVLSALTRTWTRDKEGAILLWLFKVGRGVLDDQDDTHDPGQLVRQGAKHTWEVLTDAIKSAHDKRAEFETDTNGDRDEKVFEAFMTRFLGGLGIKPETGAYGAEAWPGLDDALRGLLESGALGLPESYDMTLQSLAVRLEPVSTEQGWA
jgi:hypothetical protein